MDQAYIYMKISEYPLYLLGRVGFNYFVLSAHNLCKQAGPRSGRAESGSNLFDTQVVFQKDFFFRKS